MQTFTIIITILLFLVTLRFLFRSYVDLPKYSGTLLADSSGILNLMPEDQFWDIIHASKKESRNNYDWQCQILIEKLSSLSNEEIIQFERTFATLMAKTYKFRLWEAAYSLNGGCSDDAFEYFRTWLISLGKNKFYWTLRFPRLLFLIGVKEIMQNYEGIAYCAYQAYQNKTGSEIPQSDDIEYANPGTIFRENASFLKYPELALLAW